MAKYLFILYNIKYIYQFKRNKGYFKWLTADHIKVKFKKKRQKTTQL